MLFRSLLIVDEVQTGMGRCGELFAYMHFGLKPDIVTSAKGLGGGVPIGAMLCNTKADVFDRGDHASTFGGNPLAATAAKVVVSELVQGNLLEHVQQIGSLLKRELETLKEKYPTLIQEVRGLGLMQAIELTVPAKDIMNAYIAKGVIVVGAGEKVIRFLPPLVIDAVLLKEGLQKLDEVLSTCVEVL